MVQKRVREVLDDVVASLLSWLAALLLLLLKQVLQASVLPF